MSVVTAILMFLIVDVYGMYYIASKVQLVNPSRHTLWIGRKIAKNCIDLNFLQFNELINNSSNLEYQSFPLVL